MAPIYLVFENNLTDTGVRSTDESCSRDCRGGELWLDGDGWHVCLLKVVKAFVATFRAIDVPTLPTWVTKIVNLNDSNDLGRFGLSVCHVSKGETLRQADTIRQVGGVAIVNLDTPRKGGDAS